MLCGKAAATMSSTLLLVGTSCRPRQQHMLKALLRTTAAAVAQSGSSSSSSSHQCQKQQSLPLAQHQQQQHSPPPFLQQQQQQQQRRHFSIGSVFVGAAEQRAKTEAELAANKEQIESLIQKHQVSSVSLPVRAEFVRDSPLSTKDLESIDIHVYHRRPVTLSDHVAYRSVKLLRFFADAFFRQRYVHRAIVLETVAGVPGMVAGMLCHMRSLRRMQHDNGWIEKLLHEAENERMHLMIWMKVTEPTVLERMLVTFVQGLFFNAYMLYYLVFPRTAHRFVGYLEEEAIVSYNAFAKEVLNGNIENTPAPQVAIDYYNLDKEARLLDVVYAVRADEAAHRDANHNFADRIDDRKENLSTAAATAGEEELTQKQPQ